MRKEEKKEEKKKPLSAQQRQDFACIQTSNSPVPSWETSMPSISMAGSIEN